MAHSKNFSLTVKLEPILFIRYLHRISCLTYADYLKMLPGSL